MKKYYIASLASILLLICTFLLGIKLNQITYNNNKKEAEEILRMAHNMLEEKNYKKSLSNLLNGKFATRLNKTSENSIEKVTNTINFEDNIISDMDIIGILIIPKLHVEAPIKEGTSQEVMKTSIGHFIESDYWNGNVSFASHNSGTSAHYFEKINTLNMNDEIDYVTKIGTKKYKVESIRQIESTDWSMVVGNGNQSKFNKNTITLITCISGKPNYRLCVRGIEI